MKRILQQWQILFKRLGKDVSVRILCHKNQSDALGRGFRAVGAVKQDIGGRHEVHGIIGLQYAGSFGIGGK